jgi:hypothetical protein
MTANRLMPCLKEQVTQWGSSIGHWTQYIYLVEHADMTEELGAGFSPLLNINFARCSLPRCTSFSESVTKSIMQGLAKNGGD